ncbi:MAG: phosphoglyceromutase [Pelagibacterales bacterium]|nr:phosphoglyceromutase [Pelagibacterales bacterium]OUU61803.1 MAG: phosphoglyceromutase [Alphaproteobacteria bacterium TMED62]|tara:strand:+ start:8794 stop:9516 length:723 start_codon:yes stop_codon:yes gene_type:complete
MKRLILIRHGQSIWNAENKFTGWVDSPLSEQGIREAKKAGDLIKQLNVNVDMAFTSYLSRAISTLNILMEKIKDNNFKVYKSWYLNERHYGVLTGLNKTETKKKIGDSLFLQYRRSWNISPPPIINKKNNKISYGHLNESISSDKIPKTESLKDTYERVIKYYSTTIIDYLADDKTIIIAAHGNSLRALCKYLFEISNESISDLEIPTGNPMIINLLSDFSIDNAFYLDESRAKPLINAN